MSEVRASSCIKCMDMTCSLRSETAINAAASSLGILFVMGTSVVTLFVWRLQHTSSAVPALYGVVSDEH